MIFLLFIFIPIIEIAIFITVGSNIGILRTITIILLTAVIGIYFVRRQGLSLLFNAQKNISQGIMPAEEIKGGIFLLISGDNILIAETRLTLSKLKAISAIALLKLIKAIKIIKKHLINNFFIYLYHSIIINFSDLITSIK